MWKQQFYAKLFYFSACFSLHLLFLPTAVGDCMPPPHGHNVKLAFSHRFMNNTFPENSIATYYCENSTIEDSFKVATCQANQTWTFVETQHVTCYLSPRNRCQRSSKIGIPASLDSLIFSGTCFSLHRGINDTTLDNFEQECDIGTFRADQSPDAGPGLFPHEIKKLCRNFLRVMENKSPEETRKILLAVPVDKADSTWQKIKNWMSSIFRKSYDGKLPPKCYYLECSSNPKLCHVELEDCNAESQYWICKHNISSCGIPSQPAHSTMNHTGIHIGDNATYQCHIGYASNISPKRRCQQNGYWSNTPTCEPKDCGQPSCNANVTYKLSTRGKTTYRSWVEYSCTFPNEMLHGWKSRMCLANGSWEGESPICHPVPVDQPTENDANTSTFVPSNTSGLKPGEADLLKLCVGIIVGVTLSLTVLMWLVLACLLWHDKRQNEKSDE